MGETISVSQLSVEIIFNVKGGRMLHKLRGTSPHAPPSSMFGGLLLLREAFRVSSDRKSGESEAKQGGGMVLGRALRPGDLEFWHNTAHKGRSL